MRGSMIPSDSHEARNVPGIAGPINIASEWKPSCPGFEASIFLNLNVNDFARNRTADSGKHRFFHPRIDRNHDKVLLRPECIAFENRCFLCGSWRKIEQLELAQISLKGNMSGSTELADNPGEKTSLVWNALRKSLLQDRSKICRIWFTKYAAGETYPTSHPHESREYPQPKHGPRSSDRTGHHGPQPVSPREEQSQVRWRASDSRRHPGRRRSGLPVFPPQRTSRVAPWWRSPTRKPQRRGSHSIRWPASEQHLC
jgi:hypothetical protein